MLIDSNETTLYQQLAEAQAQIERLQENNESLRMAVQSSLDWLRVSSSAPTISAIIQFLEQFEKIDAIKSAAPQQVVNEADEPIFMDEDVIKMAKHQASNVSAAQLRQVETYRKSLHPATEMPATLGVQPVPENDMIFNSPSNRAKGLTLDDYWNKAINIVEEAESSAANEPLKAQKDKAIYAHQRSSHWLAESNEAEEKGNQKRAEKCMKKAQYWLDRLNVLEGYGDGSNG